MAETKREILSDISRRFSGDTYNYLLESTALDPRFQALLQLDKNQYHSQEEAAAHCPTDRGEGAIGVEPEETEPASKKTALESLLGDPFSKTKHFSRGIEMEIDLYRREASIPLSCCPLKWWRENSCKYPSMSPLAKAYLSIPATSVPSERVFSTAGDIVTAQRSQMLPEIVDMLIFLKKNMTISVFISSLACLEKPENNLISFCLHF